MAENVYRLKVKLVGSKPAIWRRVEVLGSSKLGDLHRVIQGVMQWEEYHLHQFCFRPEKRKRPGKETWAAVGRGEMSVNEAYEERYFSDPLFELGEDREVGDEWGVTLAEVAPQEKIKFWYEYDLGDGWEHEITVEKIGPRQAGWNYPQCTGGARRAPLEDSGGIWGWEEKINVVNNDQHEEYQELREWMGLGEEENFDAAWFDMGETNARMVIMLGTIEKIRRNYMRERKRKK